MHRLFKSKGFTLIEVLTVVVILGILIACISISVSSSLAKGRLSSTQSTLQVFAADTEQILAEYGVLTITEGDTRAQILEYISLIENFYVHTYFDKESLVVYDTYFEIKTTTMIDGWDSVFLMRYSFSPEHAGTCMLISPGSNLLFDTESYTSEFFGDDIILIVYPKGL